MEVAPDTSKIGTVASRLSSEIGNATSHLIMKRSKSFSERKALSFSAYGFIPKDRKTTTTTTTTKVSCCAAESAGHGGAEFILSSTEHKAVVPSREFRPTLHQSHLSLEHDAVTMKRKSLRDLFYAAAETETAFTSDASKNCELLSVGVAQGIDNIREEKGLRADPILTNRKSSDGEGAKGPLELQNVASLIQTDFQPKNHTWYSLFFKASKTKEACRTQDMHRGLQSVNDKDAGICINSSVKGLDGESSISFSRSKSSKAASLLQEQNTPAAKGLPRSRSVSCGGAQGLGFEKKVPSLLASWDGERDAPSMKQVSPLLPHAVLDEALDTSTGSTTDIYEAQKTISSLVALDLSESKHVAAKSNTTWERRWHAHLASPAQSFKPKPKHHHKKSDSVLDGLQPEKATTAGVQSSKQKKLHILPFFHSKDYSIINFYMSPLRFSKRKWSDKLERLERSSVSSPSTVEDTSPWSFYMTPLRTGRSKVSR
ncbi:hypothetical protein O6H91_23G012100 [Diphasiastrum complanatum]|nr:hypothetical protein O6H91_23G012100 [Diphasiastrum complanatum]